MKKYIAMQLDNGRLTTQQQKQYWDDGYLFPLPLMGIGETMKWRMVLERVEHDYGDAKMTRTLNTYKQINAQCVMPFAYKIASNPALLDVVEGILGPDILIYGAEFFIKEPNTPHVVSMHQDPTYWGLRATDNLVTAWIALSQVNSQSGCMQFVSGSHKNQILPHKDTFAAHNLLSRGQEIQMNIKDEDKVDVILEPGQFSLHHGHIIHGSGPNSSTDRRIGFAIRFINPDIIQGVTNADYAMLVRGADRKRHFIHYTPPPSLFAETHLALYEEMHLVQKQAMTESVKSTDDRQK